MHIIETARANERTLLDIARVGILPLTLRLEEWVNGVISILILPLLTLPIPPNSVLEGI